jgi:hypothetical protein
MIEIGYETHSTEDLSDDEFADNLCRRSRSGLPD